jgi:arginine decarboxylase
MKKWRVEDSAELYNINGWGVNYFDINEKGHVYVTPRKDGVQIDLKELMDELDSRNITAPVLLRFPDILDNRIEKTATCFQKAAKEYNFNGDHFIVYPIKVNQMRPVVEEIISHGKRYNIGLEAGSKPELHAVLATNMDSDSLIICNGHKDQSYIELALLAQKMGKKVFLVAEKLDELERIFETARKLGIRPQIGIRIKLAASGTGKWAESGGDASKFGLNSSELLEAVRILKGFGMEDCLKLIHFHIGSQITKIRRIQSALREASQFYVQLHAMGFNVEFVDCGGGLGIDYDGTRSSNRESSVNYSIQEYVNDCVYTFVDVANKNGIPHPNIITESGRSLTAHHSVLVLEVTDVASQPQMSEDFEATKDDHQLVQDLSEIWDNLSARSMLEDWHDAEQIRDEALELFDHGIIDLKTRAQIESLYWSITREANTLVHSQKHVPEELRRLDRLLADKYFCNFSLFQSLPDSWGIDQLFPVMPIQRLEEKPTRNVTLQDITCDSDGKISQYVNSMQQTSFIPLHSIRRGERYYLGVFLVGAYQEILGNMHNLFGDTNAVHITVGDNSYSIDRVIEGETVAEVLDYVQYDAKRLQRRLETWVKRAEANGKISVSEGNEFLSNYRSGLYGYTYLELNDDELYRENDRLRFKDKAHDEKENA